MLCDAAAFYVETFDADGADWSDRDPGEMDVVFIGGFGDGPGSLQGSFAAQGVPAPESDAFRITGLSSGGSFTGDYLADVPTFASWTFSFYVGDVLPSSVVLAFDANGTLFLRNLSAQVTSVGQWLTLSAPLQYDGGWFGGTGATFSNGFANVGFIDIQITRSGTGAQTYYVDNFELAELDAGPGPGGGAVPEPGTLSFLALAAGVVVLARRKLPPAGRKAARHA